MKIVLFFLIAGSTVVFGQTIPNIEWVKNYSDRDSIVNVPSAIDVNNNIYVTGYTFSGGSRSFTTIKYDPDGNLIWVNNYNGPVNGDDISHAIKIDPQGNIIVVGESEGNGTGKDFTTIKYDQNGNELWVNRFDGASSGNDYAYNTTFDLQGNIYVTGKTQGSSSFNAITIKYSPNGNQLWTSIYETSINSENIGIDIRGNFIYTFARIADVDAKTILFKINRNNGNLNNSLIFQGNGEHWIGNTFKIEGNRAALVGKYVDNNKSYYFTSSINTGNLSVNWTNFYDDYNGDAVAYDVCFNSQGNVIVTGTVNNSGIYEYHTVNYNGGNVNWINKVSTHSSFLNAHPSIVIDNFNHFYVCGEKFINTPDIYVYQISDGGNLTWEETYNGQQNGIDAAVDIVSAGNGILYIAAQTQNSSARFDYTTIKIAQTPVYFPIDVNDEAPNNLFAFFENNGQLLNSDGTLANEVLFWANNPKLQFFASKKYFSFVKSKLDTATNIRDTVQRIDMNFQGYNAEVKPYKFEIIPFQQNYFLPHCPNGVTSSGHLRLMYPNYYTGIDLHFFNSENGMKYYFVVKPNADVSQIIHFFNGASSTYINSDGQLVLETFGEDILLNKPKAYTFTPLMTALPVSNVDWSHLGGNHYSFSVPAYNSSLPLVIQIDQGDVTTMINPKGEDNLIWSTYYGGTGRTTFEDVDNDDFGNSFYAGTANQEDFPIVFGQSLNLPYTGGTDAIIVKLNNLIEPQWATYFGGSTSTGFGGPLRDQLNAIAVANDGTTLYIVGQTNSIDLPINDGGGAFYSDNQNDGLDGFIARFDGAGILQWSTYFGATGEDRLNDVSIDPISNFVYAVGRRGADSPILHIPNGINFSSGRGAILQFDASNNLIWSNAWDCSSIEAVGTDFLNRFYITGTTDFSTASANMPVLNADPAFPSTTTKQPHDDAFVSAIEKDGPLVYSLFYGGNQHDRANDMVVDRLGTVYLAGTTSQFISSATVSSDLPNAGTGLPLPLGENLAHGFLAKIKPYVSGAAEIEATSYLGCLGSDLDLRLAVNGNQVLFVAGRTYHHFLPTPSLGTDMDFPVNQPAGFYTIETRPTSDVDLYSDAFVAAFDRNFNLLWNTYFGGHFREETNALSFSPIDSRLYFAGNTTTNNAELNPGDTPLPNFEFDTGPGTFDYYQQFPFQSTDLPAWAAFFDVELMNDPTVSIGENYFDENTLIIYPNPTTNQLNISAEQRIEAVNILDLNGRLVYSEKTNNSNTIIQIKDLSNGVYMVHVQTEQDTFRKKIVKQ